MTTPARRLAQALVSSPQTPLAAALRDSGPAALAELAWALKAECYEAWSTDPGRTLHAADRLQALAEQHGGTELQALAAWTRGIAGLTQGRMSEAAAQLDAAHHAFGRLGDTRHAAETLVPQVIALSMLGRDDEALACAQQALAQFIAVGDERSAGKVELNLGSMLTRQDRHAEAGQLYRRAAVRFARVSDLAHSVMADIGLANALTWQFDTDEALRINERARMRAATHGLRLLQVQAQVAIGRIELHRGRYHRALAELAQASQTLEGDGAALQQRLEADAALADAYLAVNLLPEAVALYDRVIAITQATQAAPEQARALLERSRAQARLGQTTAAIDALQRARDLFTAAGNAASVALVDLNLGALHLRAGHAQAALDAARLVLGTLQAAGIVGWQLEAQALAAAALAALGRSDEAAAGYRETLAAALGLPQLEGRCRIGLARLAAAAGDHATAVQQLDAALGFIDSLRAALPGDEFRSAVAADTEQATDLLVRLALDHAPDQPAGVLQAMERGRGRALDLGLQRGPGRHGAEGQLGERLQWTRDRWREALAGGEAAAASDLARHSRELEAQLLETYRRAVLLAGDAGHCGPPRPLDAGPLRLDTAALQQALSDDMALVELHRLGDRLVACVATRDGVRCTEWAAPGLDDRLDSLRFQLESPRFGGPLVAARADQLRQRAIAQLQAMHRLVWAPLAGLLGGRPRVVVVPHGALHYLPFSALHDGRHWLMEAHEISLAPSASVWLHLQGLPSRGLGSVLAVGVGGAALPSVAGEVDAVAAAFGPRARTLRDAEATQGALREAVPGADVLHLACHGEFRADSPYFSSLALADGPLTLHDVMELPLTAGLVVLSACETGISRLAPGDELLGLVRGFMMAGAPTVMATLWAVDDVSTGALMGRFYGQLAAGVTPSRALQKSQQQAAQAGLHPFHWAAITLHGSI